MHTNRNLLRATIGAVVLASAVAAAHAADGDPIPAEKHIWLKFGVGTTVTMSSKADMGAMGKQERTESFSLAAKDKDGFTLTHSASGQDGRAQTRDQKETMPKAAGTESIEVVGKKLETTVYASSVGEGGTNRIWLADGVAAPVRFAFKDSNGETTLNAVSLSEKITIADATYDCVKLEGSMSSRNGMSGTITMWMSADMPGGTVRMKLDANAGGMAIVVVNEVTKVEKK